MQSRLLTSFLVVAEQGNITRAAQLLNVSQPALTNTIKQLEESYGVALFERVSSGVQLTKYGEILRRHVKVMDNEHRHAVAQIDELRDGRAGALRIGAGPVWLVSLLPPVIAKFHEILPDVSVSLLGGVIDTLVPELVQGDLDLICVSLDFPNRSEVIKRPLIDTHHVLVADPNHPLCKAGPVDATDIQNFPWMVLKSDYVGTQRISSFFAANGLRPPRVIFETTSIHSLLQSLLGAHSVAHIPVQMLPLAHSLGVQKIDLTQTIWETTAGYAYRTSTQIRKPLRIMMELLDDLHGTKTPAAAITEAGIS